MIPASSQAGLGLAGYPDVQQKRQKISRDHFHSMNATTLNRLNSLPAPPLREYYSRVLAYIAVAGSELSRFKVVAFMLWK